MSKIHKSIAALLAAGATTLSGPVAFAQGAAAAEGLALEEIVVTARKREESLQEVPLAVTALTSTDITNRGLGSLDDVAAFTPGLVFSKSFGRTADRPVMRGLGSILAASNATVETGVAYFVDGVYYPGDIQSLDLNDLERVEVIRGPQSALYGRNTYSGAINFITRRPKDVMSGAISGNVDPDERQVSARLSGPLTDSLSANVSARYYKFDGQFKNQLTGRTIGDEETKSVSVAMNWQASENVEARVRLQHNDDNDGTRPLFFQDPSQNNCYPGYRSLNSYSITTSTNNFQWFCGEVKPGQIYLNDAPVTQTFPQLPGIPANMRLSPFYVASGGTVYDTRSGTPFSGVARKLDLATYLVSWNIRGTGYTLTVDGGIRNEDRFTGSDSDHSQVNIIGANVNGVQPMALGSSADLDKFNDWSAEVKLASPTTDRFRWMVGSYHYEWERRDHYIDFLSPKGQDRPTKLYDTINQAFFASTEFDFTDRLKGSLEWRKAREDKSEIDFGGSPTTTSAGVTNVQSGPTFTIYNSKQRGSGRYNSSTPRATLNFKVNPDVTVYAVYAKGFKPGGFNGTAALSGNRPDLETFKEEQSINYELGVKSLLMERRLLLNVSAYRIDVKDIQLTTPIANGATGSLTSLSTNQGSGEVKGLEIESRFVATEQLTLGLTYSLADTKFTKGCDDFQWTLTSGGGLIDPPGAALNPARNPNGQGNCSIAGHPFPLAAKHTGSATADYKRPIMGGAYNFYFNSDLSYTGKKTVQVDGEAYTGSAVLLGARFGVETDKWKAGFYGRNLTNEDSVPGATRWLDLYLIGTQAPGIANIKPGLPSSTVVSYSTPRGFFGSLRRERQIGLEASYKF